MDDWAAPSDIAAAIGEDRGDLSSTFRSLVEEGAIKGRGATKSREYHIGSSVTEPDGNGARTDTERRIVESVGSLRLTMSEIAANSGVPEHQVREIVGGLARRGVLEREDYGGKSLYGVTAA